MAKKKLRKLEEVIDMNSLNNLEEVESSGLMKVRKPGFGVINAPTGKRLTMPQKMYDKLKAPETVQIGLLDEDILVGEVVPKCSESHIVKQKSKGGGVCIYCAELVKAITEKYGLDFSECSSMTFSDIEYCKKNKKRIAVIHMHEAAAEEEIDDQEDTYEGENENEQ